MTAPTPRGEQSPDQAGEDRASLVVLSKVRNFLHSIADDLRNHQGIRHEAAKLLDRLVNERQPYPGQQWKCGDEFLPFHPQASHVPPDYRDGWNRCFWMAVGSALPPAPREMSDSEIDAIIEEMFPNDRNPYHIEWMEDIARPIARAILAAPAPAAPKEAQEPVAWRREWDGDESDLGHWLYTDDEGDTKDGYQWQPLFAASPSQPQPGWRLVPEEPTPEMVAAGYTRDPDGSTWLQRPAETYRAMLAASPQPQTGGGEDVGVVRKWQHDETGRITETAECPGPRWTEVPDGVKEDGNG